ncbi:MAG TPA: hypothetical protein DIW46_00465 [Microbacterium sp.]|uniref:aminoglycoside phosphotransferase family protein n=1 Tax=Microbacterium sp. TaxID=51671 RepID=UPI000EC851A9|nr:hypothetical protein [Microbacterium sp.]
MQSQTHDLSFTDTEVRKRFLSWADGEADRERGCLQLLWKHAPGIAPRPLKRETVDRHPVVTMERLPGRALGHEPLTSDQTASLGKALRRLYDIPTERISAAGISERRYGPSTLPQALLSWLREAHDLSACQDPAQVRDGIEAALEGLTTPGALPAARLTGLGIADLNPANILWDGETCRLVDFEDGGMTDPAYDLADHVEHIASRLTGVFDPEALCAAIGFSDEERERMRAYRPLWAAFWLVMLLPSNGGFHRNPPGSTEAQALHLIRLIS